MQNSRKIWKIINDTAKQTYVWTMHSEHSSN